MSDSRICYVPVKGIDDVIANQVPSWNSHYVANLRGLYETKKGVSTTDIKELITLTKEYIVSGELLSNQQGLII